MTTQQLQAFLTAADTLNFTSAANQLFLSQPALSRQIAALEAELGLPLFVRGNHVLELTAEGAFFRSRAQKLYESYEILLRETRDFHAGINGYLHIGLLEDQRITPKLADGIKNLIHDRPTASINICRGTYRELVDRLKQGTLDICQLSIYSGIPQTIYRTMAMSEEPLYLALPKCACEEKTQICAAEIPEALHGLPLVAAATESYPELIQHYLPAFNVPNVRFVEAISSIPLYVTTGLAATLINENNLLFQEPEITLVRIEDIPKVVQGLLWCSGNANPLLTRLLERIES